MSTLAELRMQGHTIIQPDTQEVCHASGKQRSPNCLYKVMTVNGPAWECLPESRCKTPPCNNLQGTSGTATAGVGDGAWGAQWAGAAGAQLWGPQAGAARFTPYGGGDEAMLRALIDKVKAGQRASEDWKERWWAWCDANGGTRDPARRTVQELQQAIMNLGEPPANGAPGYAGAPRMGAVPQSEEHQQLINQIKTLQRTNPAWKQGWDQICEAEGGGKRDPARHDPGFLRRALERLATA
eukprot:Hpha_TRINITY_DN11563_c0_g2::TRINITY_DN11563_c0_g2_i1::g.32316::m.32316